MNKDINILHHMTADRARQLIERFDSGDTTIAEEQALYDFFRDSAHLPDDLEQLRPLMAWYEGGCIGEIPGKTSAVKPKRHLLRPILAAAASAALLITAGLGFIHHNEQAELQAFAEAHPNSYIIRDGVKITNPAEVRQAILKAEEQMARARKLMEQTDPDAVLANAIERAVGHNPVAYRAAMEAIQIP